MRAIVLPSALLLFLLAGPSWGWERAFSFDKDPVEVPPEGFIVEAPSREKPQVAVERNAEVARSKPNLLSMCGAAIFGINSAMCIAWFSDIADGRLSVAVRRDAQEMGPAAKLRRAAGLVWRYQSGGPFCALELDSRKRTLSLLLVTEKETKVLAREKAEWPAEQWVTLGVSFNGSEAVGRIGGKDVVRTDKLPAMEAGKVGLLLESEVPVLFDDFIVAAEE